MSASGSRARAVAQQAIAASGCVGDSCQQSGSVTDSPRWSPDGRLLSYRLVQNLAQGSVWVATVDGSAQPREVARSADLCIFNEGWTPDGRSLFSRCAAGSVATNATYASAGAMAPKVLVTGSQIAYGPGATAVAFSRQSPQGDDMSVALYVAGSDGAGAALVALGGQSPAWSSSGLLAYQVSGPDGWQLHVYDPGAGSDRVLDTRGMDGLLGGWTPDGGWLYFTTVDATGSSIRIIRADGSGLTVVAAGSTPDWVP
jgi:hypothetical protein